MKNYLDLLTKVINDGDLREGRNGYTRSLFGEQLRFDLAAGFPLLTTKKVHLKSIIVELLWFLGGDTNTTLLHEHGVTIWDEWADANGNLGPVYGKQWRSWSTTSVNCGCEYTPAIDQIAQVIEGLRSDPYGRRHIVSAWNVADIPDMALPPCHCLFQFHVRKGKLSCQLYQRSADIFLGVPFNIASYALLTMMVAKVTGLQLGELIMTFGDIHLYEDHLHQALTQVERTPNPSPTMSIADHASIDAYQLGDFTLHGYHYEPAIHAKVAA